MRWYPELWGRSGAARVVRWYPKLGAYWGGREFFIFERFLEGCGPRA